MTMRHLDYRIFDADNHYYEVEDTFIRFGDEKVRRHIRWVQEGKRRHLPTGPTLKATTTRRSTFPASNPWTPRASGESCGTMLSIWFPSCQAGISDLVL